MNASKKRKVGGAGMNADARTALTIDKPNYGKGMTLTSFAKDDQTSFKTESQEKKKSRGLSMKLLTDLFAPRFSFTRIGHGNDFSKRAWNSWEMTQQRAGTARMCYANNGYQWWGEFLALPMNNPGTLKTSLATSVTSQYAFDLFHTSIDQLINKAYDVRNETTASYVNSYKGISTMDVERLGDQVGTGIAKMKQLYQNNFCYEGGYQSHTFENVGASPVIIECWECIPREPMALVTLAPELAFGGNNSFADAALVPNSIRRQLLKSYKANLPIANTVAPFYEPSVVSGNTVPNNASTDDITDASVRINKDSLFVHTHWYVKKPIKHTLQPGDRYTHKMHLKAFELDSTAMLNLTNNVEFFIANGQNFEKELPGMIPQFTKHLAVRIVGTTNWSGTTAFNTARTSTQAAFTAGTTRNFEYFGGGINIGTSEVRVIHQCSEHHSCRMLPEQFGDSHFIDDQRDKNNAASFDVNPATNAEAEDTAGGGGGSSANFAV